MISLARNSSNNSTWRPTVATDSPRPRAWASSRRPSTQDASRPTTTRPACTWGSRAAARRLTSTRAWSIIPWSQKGAPAAQWSPGLPIRRLGDGDPYPIASGTQHGQGGVRDLWIEMAGEGIDQQHHLGQSVRPGAPGPRRQRRRVEGLPRRFRQRAVGGDPQPGGRPPCQDHAAITPAHQGLEPGHPVQPTRCLGKEPAAQTPALPGPALGQVFRLDQGHIHVGLALALAALAGHAQIHGRGQGRVGQRRRDRVAAQGRLEQPDPPAGREVGVTADLEARAHHKLALGLALAAVDADRDGLGEVTAVLGDIGVGVTDPGVLIGRPVEPGLHRRPARAQRRLQGMGGKREKRSMFCPAGAAAMAQCKAVGKTRTRVVSAGTTPLATGAGQPTGAGRRGGGSLQAQGGISDRPSFAGVQVDSAVEFHARLLPPALGPGLSLPEL